LRWGEKARRKSKAGPSRSNEDSQMADVVVTVMIDGKQAFVAGAAGAPDGCACATAGLSMGLDHFKAMAAAAAPAVQRTAGRIAGTNVGGVSLQDLQTGQAGSQSAAKPDTSL
jgi:hypothetical protein